MGPSGRGGVMQRSWWGCECMGILMKRLSEFMRMWANDVRSKLTIQLIQDKSTTVRVYFSNNIEKTCQGFLSKKLR
ncbi:hypothetical protein M0802_016153 [Mischocyttarus mexicanus]|nr:hypothetical protein M0802_016153 [Mischocyttarus mexicanus]